MLGDELFFKSLHQYMNVWHGKHPMPYDFFYSINAASDKDLNWFWKKWFFGWEYPDLSIEKVAGSRGRSKITIRNKGGLPVPVYLTITSSSGEELVLRSTAEIWKWDKTKAVINAKIPFRKISKIVLGNEFIPEKYREDNVWDHK